MNNWCTALALVLLSAGIWPAQGQQDPLAPDAPANPKNTIMPGEHHPFARAESANTVAPGASFPAAPTSPVNSVVPGASFPVEHYSKLWLQSPFAVASATVAASPDFALLAVAKIDGVSYATMLQKQTQQHFVVSSQEPAHGLTLVSIQRGKNADGTIASFLQSGQSITLPLETAKPGDTPEVNATPIGPVGATPTYLPIGAPIPRNLPSGAPRPPPALRHRARIFVPPPPAAGNPL